MSIPCLKGKGKQAVLYVHDKPFVCLGGEIHNSSASDLSYMDTRVWPALRPLHLNTVLAPVYWELMEPREGVFDFALVDGLIAQCRREKVKLIPLWFGLWKSTWTMYAPGWVKRDPRFRLVHKADGTPVNTFDPLCQASIEADKKAFTALMAHIKAVDAQENTVIMVQCENECGMFGTPRDYSAAATEQFTAPVPAAVAAHCGVSGDWRTAFGADAEERFSAWSFAQAVEQIAAAGRAVYDLPMLHNAWLDIPPFGVGGNFPSGGCTQNNLLIWQATAPSIDCFGPNAYDDVRKVSDQYAVCGNPLFIPETGGGPAAAASALYAVGKHNAIGFAPFGAEGIYGIPMGLIDPPFEMPAGTPGGTPPMMGGPGNPRPQPITLAYDLLANLQGTIAAAHRAGTIHAFKESGDNGLVIETEKFRINVVYAGKVSNFISGGGFPTPKQPGTPDGGGFLIQEDEETFTCVGLDYRLEFQPRYGCTDGIAYDFVEEGSFINDQWVPGRRLNGDEIREGVKLGKTPEARRVRVYTYR